MAFTPGWALAQPGTSDPQAPVPAVAFTSVFDVAAPQTPLPKPLKGQKLYADQAVTLALRLQPDLFMGPNTLALDKAQAQAGLLKLSHSVHRAWIEAVAARQNWATLREIHEATQIAAELAQRMANAGNWSKVPLLQAQLLESGTATQVALAQAQSFAAQEKLIKRLGLWGEQARIDLPQQLPDLPAAPLPWANLEAQALRHKPALAQASSNAQVAQSQVNVQDLLALQQSFSEAAAQRPGAQAPGEPTNALANLPHNPPTLPRTLAVPNPALENALIAQTRLETLAVNTRSQTREAWFRYRTAFDVARHQRDVVVPLTVALQEEIQLRYNGMLQSTWELLASARARLEGANAAVMAQRDFWLAHTDLQAVLAGGEVEFTNNGGPTGSASSTSQGH